MFKKVTTIIPVKPKVLVRKAVMLTGVTLGIAIGLLLSKVEDPDVIVVEEEFSDDKPGEDSDKSWSDDEEPKMLEGNNDSES